MAARTPVKVDCPHGGRHTHGTRTAYTEDGCGCTPCTTANTRAKTIWRMNRDLGRSSTADAGPVREHLEAFRAAQYTFPQISAATGVAVTTLRHIVLGTPRADGTRPLPQRISATVADKVLSAPLPLAPSVPGRGVDPTGAMRRIQSLMALGWSSARIAERAGVHRTTILNVLAGKPTSASVAQRIADAYDALQHRRPVPRDGEEAKGITRTLRRAERERWPVPAAWDEADLDDPSAPVPVAAHLEPVSSEPVTRISHDLLDEWVLLVSAGVDVETASQRVGSTSLRSVRRSARNKGREDVLELIERRRRTGQVA